MDVITILPAFDAACKAEPALTIQAFLDGYPPEMAEAILDAIEELLVAEAEMALAAEAATPEMLAIAEAARLRVLAELGG